MMSKSKISHNMVFGDYLSTAMQSILQELFIPLEISLFTKVKLTLKILKDLLRNFVTIDFSFRSIGLTTQSELCRML